MKTLFAVFLLVLTAPGCDAPGEVRVGCAMHLSGVRPTAPNLEHKPWVALNLVGKDCSESDLKDVRVSLYDTKPDLIYRGDGELVKVAPASAGFGGLCAIYQWPEWASAVTSWGILATPRAPQDEKAMALRASWVAAEMIPDYAPGGSLPAWNTPGDGWGLYLGEDGTPPSCTPVP